MKNLKIKWFSIVVMLCLALTSVFSATLSTTQVFASDSDVTVSMRDTQLVAGQTGSFTVTATAPKGFSSYEMKFSTPDFVEVEKIESNINVQNGLFVVGGEYHVTFSSASMMNDTVALFTVIIKADATSGGRSGNIHFYDGKFTNTSGSHLNVEMMDGLVTVTAPAATRQKGDFDGNGSVNIQDVMLMQRYITGQYSNVGSEDIWAGDIDDNKEIDIYDCQYVQSYIIGLISSLDNIGENGGNEHGDENFLGEYTAASQLGTVFLQLGEDKDFQLITDDLETSIEGTYQKQGNTLYLVKDFFLFIVEIDTASHTFEVKNRVDFREEEATATGYEGEYIVNDNAEDRVMVAENGAFVRTCIEDGLTVQYNGMIEIKNDDDSSNIEAVAHIFGTDESSSMISEPFTLDKDNNGVYFEEGSDEQPYAVTFYVNGNYICNYVVQDEMSYEQYYDRFVSEYGQRLSLDYGEVDYSNGFCDDGSSPFSGNIVRGNVNVYFTSKGDSDWTEDTSKFEVYGNGTMNVYIGSSEQQVVDALVGQRIRVQKCYYNSRNESRSTDYKEVSLTADMVGDLSNINFSSNEPTYLEIPLVIEGRSAKLRVYLVPDMTTATLLDTFVSSDTYYTNNGEPHITYSYIEAYDNDYMLFYSINGKGEISQYFDYMKYVTVQHNGTTLYGASAPSTFRLVSGTIKLGDSEYKFLTSFIHTEGQETTDYTLIAPGAGQILFRVFDDCFAEMYNVYGTTEMYGGTVQVSIDGDTFIFGGMNYSITGNNMLVMSLPEGEPLFVADISGADVYFYENGMAYVCFNGTVSMTMDWIGSEDNSVVYCSLMGEEITFYKWSNNGYYKMEEPDWNDRSLVTITLAYGDDVYTLYNFVGNRAYLNDGKKYYEVNYIDNDCVLLFYQMSTEVCYYFTYNDTDNTGYMYDATRYQVRQNGEYSGYLYEVLSRGFLVGDLYLNNGVRIDNGIFSYTVNKDGDYVVTYNNSELFTATPKQASNPMENNELVIVPSDNQSTGNDGETTNNDQSTDEECEITVWYVIGGKFSDPEDFCGTFDEFIQFVRSYAEQARREGHIMTGVFVDSEGKESLTPDNFSSGDVYFLLEEQ